MYYLATDGLLYDDGHGEVTAPAYAVDRSGRRHELALDAARAITERFRQEHSPGFGDMVARATGALGIQHCAPCKRRQQALNQFGANVAGFFYGRKGQ